MIFKIFVNGGIRVELSSHNFSFLWLSGWVDPNKNVILYFILFTCWASVFSPGYRFGNSKALVSVWPVGSSHDKGKFSQLLT